MKLRRAVLRVQNHGKRALLTACLVGCMLSSACQGKASSSTPPPGDAASFEAFQLTVYPILMRDCAFNACHGAPQRFFQVFGPGRARIGLDLKSEVPATMMELQTSYDRARSMLVTEGPITSALLLAKPLEGKAGGVGHRGADNFGRNVYTTVQDPAYLALARWALAVIATTGTTPPAGAAGMQGSAGTLGGAGAAGSRGGGLSGRGGTGAIAGAGATRGTGGRP